MQETLFGVGIGKKLKCPDCEGNLKPLKKKGSEHFAICDKCKNGYNINYNPPKIYYEEKKKECKFKDSKGKFRLNGVIVEWEFKPNYFDGVPHFEFNGKPNALTETGYRSHFLSLGEKLENYDKIEDVIDDILKANIKKKFEVEFIDENKVKPIIHIERRSDKSHLVYLDGGLSGLYSEDKEGKEKEEIETAKAELMRLGFKEEEIEIKEHYYEYQDDNPKFVEKKIKELSEELKKYLKKKYGFDVTIRVLKGGEEQNGYNRKN